MRSEPIFRIPGPEVVDAKGKYVLPGAVDIHTHMDLDVGIARVIDDFYTGTIAAACGGTTSIVDHMAFGPQNCSLWHQVKEYHRLAHGNAVVDYGFHGVFQHVNPQVLEEMGEIAKEEGITSFKVYMTYGYGLGDSDLMQILIRAKAGSHPHCVPLRERRHRQLLAGKICQRGTYPGKVSSDQPSGSGGRQRQ